MKFFLTFTLIFLYCSIHYGYGQNPLLQIVSPSTENATVTVSKQFITGKTCPECSIAINGVAVKVYKTGVFAFPIILNSSSNTFVIIATKDKKVIQKIIQFNYAPPKPIKETDSTVIESITIEPSGDIALQAGEYILLKVKAKPNCKVLVNGKFELPELHKNETKGIGGFYQLNYQLKETDKLLATNLIFSLLKDGVVRDSKKDKNSITLFDTEMPMIGKTNMTNTPVYTGLGEDRLGGTKAGFLDSAIQVHIVGRINNLFKIRFNATFTGFVPREQIDVLPLGYAIPKSLSNNITIVGDSVYDYVKISLNSKLPYLTTQNTKPNQVILDIYGATSNSNWLMQFPETLQEIEDVGLQQISDGQLRLIIDLQHKNLWGYKCYYEGNALVLQVRRQKNNLQLSNMTIGLDAGHGGSNDGARGISGKYEKEFTLLIAKEVEALLLKEGAKVIMSRQTDISYENAERLKMYRKQMPDFAISIHLNSAGDPLRVKGASTYYKYPAFRSLSTAIYRKITETGLNGWGNIGNFNFHLNSPTEFPSALVECLFISNPDDEEKVHDASFRNLLARKIVEGIKEWLQECAANK